MDKSRFWSIVDATQLDPPTCQADVDIGERNRRFEAALAALTNQEIVDFRRLLIERMIEANRWDLYAAATLINDGCNATEFLHFRAWLVSQGQEVFEAALRNPESLADNTVLKFQDSAMYPAFWSIPWIVYRKKTRKDMPDLGISERGEPTGTKLTEIPAELAEKFPRLFKTYYREGWEESSVEPEYEEAKIPPPLKAPVPPMAEERFWTLIDEARKHARKKKRPAGKDFLDVHIGELHELLSDLTPEELIAYSNRFHYYEVLAYRWDLWAVAYWLGGGCSDDGFMDFRACLISLGKEWYFQVLNDPDSLTDLIGRKDVPFMQAEGFQYVDFKVYREKTGYAAMPEVLGQKHRSTRPKGKRFDFEDREEMAKRFPKLVAQFPDGDD